ncbi:hypothetical protein ACMVR2_003487 [Yersinia enterocolitica]
MSTHINTINALKGLTCAANSLIPLTAVDSMMRTIVLRAHVRKHLVAAGLEIERLNNEANTLRCEVAKLKESRNGFASSSRLGIHWASLIDAISQTPAGENMPDHDWDVITMAAVAAINKIEADRKEALLTAESFQRAKFKAEPEMDVNIAWLIVRNIK